MHGRERKPGIAVTFLTEVQLIKRRTCGFANLLHFAGFVLKMFVYLWLLRLVPDDSLLTGNG